VPTGDEEKGLGTGKVSFEPYISTATVIGSQSYLQGQFKIEMPDENPWQDKAVLYNIYFGHDVKLLAPQHVKPYVRRNKNDGRDAEGLRDVPRLVIEQPACHASFRFVYREAPQ
jgi:hypothetical protein